MKPEYNKKLADILCLMLVISAVHGLIGLLNGMWPWNNSPYYSYALQASSWLQGRLDVDYCAHLEQAFYMGRYYISFPPFPSYVMLPLVAIWGMEAPQGWLAFAVVCLGAVYALRMAWHYLGTGVQAVFWVCFLYLGTNMLYITLDSSVWFIAQSMAVTLTLMAIWYAIQGQGGICLFFWACAVGCRPFQAVYLPLLLYALYKKLSAENTAKTVIDLIRHKFYWLIPAGVVALSYMWLNYARFGNPLEFGHNYLPEFTRAEYGQFSVHYLTDNLKTLLRLPINSAGKLEFYKFNGNNIFIVSPLFVSYFILFFDSEKKDKAFSAMSLILVAVHIFILCLHRTMGGYHFGHRYINDTLPVIYWAVLMFRRNNRAKYSCLHILLFALGLVINIYGAVTVML